MIGAGAYERKLFVSHQDQGDHPAARKGFTLRSGPGGNFPLGHSRGRIRRGGACHSADWLADLAGFYAAPTRLGGCGSIDDLPPGHPRQLDRVTAIRNGWMETKSYKADVGGGATAGRGEVFSPICTHLGYGYRWDDAEHKFLCPCHGSWYDLNGQVLGGRAPRPFDVLPSKVEGGRLLVMYKEFKSVSVFLTSLHGMFPRRPRVRQHPIH